MSEFWKFAFFNVVSTNITLFIRLLEKFTFVKSVFEKLILFRIASDRSISDKFAARNEAKDKFGKYPTQTEFIRGVIYQWIRKQTPHILIDDLKGGVPEIIEHKKLKKK